MTEPVRYSGTKAWRDQPEVWELVDRAAVAKGTKPSEWLRQAVRTVLRADGFDPAQITTNSEKAA
ncbi:hypothetical protein [Bradyrhizobium sp. AUGA SZCCT0431]|uniref:hypothetical protein n=1 Tax=Bradyrhizobium sp. AUGA SZCCT0431 TaxID=2807674 RepID=UPI001BA6277A|nr:hypothetical protein [Bradyrhizobium sp. AUGA SZCCT0431]MBR1145083.1 hypothetical protein [Bradyrhizobium sp. AUGA SZCCT0431]